MTTHARDSQLDAAKSDFSPLSVQEAAHWRSRNPSTSVWRVIVWQAVVGTAVAVAAWIWTGSVPAGWSAAYGALAVVLPAAVFARGVFRRAADAGAAAAKAGMVRFFIWEIAKILLTVAMLVMAARVVVDLSWLALLAGMVVTMKTYWIALMLRPRYLKPIDKEAS